LPTKQAESLISELGGRFFQPGLADPKVALLPKKAVFVLKKRPKQASESPLQQVWQNLNLRLYFTKT
jgi:hypothetical protein